MSLLPEIKCEHNITSHKDFEKEVKINYNVKENSQFPLDIKFNSKFKFDFCPICLEDNKNIKNVVMLNCGHRFCFGCVSPLKSCALCRDDILPEDQRCSIRLDYNGGDFVWWHLPENNKDDDKILKYYLLNRFRKLFGRINILHGIQIYNDDGTFDSKCAFEPVDLARGKKLRVYYREANIRGYTKEEFVKRWLQSIIINILEFQGNINGESLQNFVHDRWPQVSREDMGGVVKNLIDGGYCRWQSNVLHYQH